jgi:hypothetical protein
MRIVASMDEWFTFNRTSYTFAVNLWRSEWQNELENSGIPALAVANWQRMDFAGIGKPLESSSSASLVSSAFYHDSHLKLKLNRCDQAKLLRKSDF